MISLSKPKVPIIISIDPTLINQALTNILKNAGESIETRMRTSSTSNDGGIIDVSLQNSSDGIVIKISDNGVGLPQDRLLLFEPYVTTREKGTGLWLAIVKKIIEEHGGILKLDDSDPFEKSVIIGALVTIELPKSKNL